MLLTAQGCPGGKVWGPEQGEHCSPGPQQTPLPPCRHPTLHNGHTADATPDPATGSPSPHSHSSSITAAPGRLPPAAARRQILPEHNLLWAGPIDAPSPPGQAAKYHPQVGRQAEGGWLHSAWQCQPLPQHPGCLRSGLATVFIPQWPAEHPEVGVPAAAWVHRRGGSAATLPPTRNESFPEASAGQRPSAPVATASAPHKPAVGTPFSNSAPQRGLSVCV